MKHLKIQSSDGEFDLYPGNSKIIFGLEIEYASTYDVSFPRFRLTYMPENFWINESDVPRSLVPSHYWDWREFNVFPTAFALWNSPSEVTKRSGKVIKETGEVHEVLIEFIDDSPF